MRVQGSREHVLESVITRIWSWASIPQTGAVRDPWEKQLQEENGP